MYGSIAAHCSDIVCVGGHFPAHSLPEQRVCRLFALIPSHTFPYILIYSAQCGVQAIGLYFVFTLNKGVTK